MWQNNSIRWVKQSAITIFILVTRESVIMAQTIQQHCDSGRAGLPWSLEVAGCRSLILPGVAGHWALVRDPSQPCQPWFQIPYNSIALLELELNSTENAGEHTTTAEQLERPTNSRLERWKLMSYKHSCKDAFQLLLSNIQVCQGLACATTKRVSWQICQFLFDEFLCCLCFRTIMTMECPSHVHS